MSSPRIPLEAIPDALDFEDPDDRFRVTGRAQVIYGQDPFLRPSVASGHAEPCDEGQPYLPC
jgi:hypothetical protein